MSPSSSSEVVTEIRRIELIKFDADGKVIERIVYDADGKVIERETHGND